MTNFINQIIFNQFRVDAFIASGGMGAVYRVWDLKRNVPLAMKTLHSDLADEPHIIKRLKREANALKKLTHPHIVQYYGLFATRKFTFLLESYIDGPSMKEILGENWTKPMSTQEALSYIKAISSALGYAHKNGVVHCDVKPANILVDLGGNLYLTDFGIARHAESTITTMGAISAAAYMAPEQIQDEAVTPATDIYALGVMLFEMLTGKRPFCGSEAGTEKGGNTANERISYANLHLQPPNPQSLNLSISQDLAQVILKALDKNSSRRYQTMQEFFEAVCAASGTTPAHIPDRIVVPASLQISAFPTSTLQPSISHSFPAIVSRKLVIPLLIGSLTLIPHTPFCDSYAGHGRWSGVPLCHGSNEIKKTTRACRGHNHNCSIGCSRRRKIRSGYSANRQV